MLRMTFVDPGVAFTFAMDWRINDMICGKRLMRQLARVSRHKAYSLVLYGHSLTFGTTATLAVN